MINSGKTNATVEALLFDLGGVVIDIDFERIYRAWAPLTALPLAEIRRRFSMDEAYQQHERGEIDAAAYFNHVRRLLDLHADDASIAAGWNAIFVGEITASIHCIRTAAQRLPCYALTNSNPTHQACWSAAYPSVVGLFRHIFVSSDLGARKPEKAAFDAIAAATGVTPGAILFFDDALDNVHGAQAAGLQGVHVQGPSDVQSALTAIGAI